MTTETDSAVLAAARDIDSEPEVETYAVVGADGRVIVYTRSLSLAYTLRDEVRSGAFDGDPRPANVAETPDESLG